MVPIRLTRPPGSHQDPDGIILSEKEMFSIQRYGFPLFSKRYCFSTCRSCHLQSDPAPLKPAHLLCRSRFSTCRPRSPALSYPLNCCVTVVTCSPALSHPLTCFVVPAQLLCRSSSPASHISPPPDKTFGLRSVSGYRALVEFPQRESANHAQHVFF